VVEISTRRRASACGSPTAPSNSGSRPRCRKPVPRCGTTESATGWSAWAPTGTNGAWSSSRTRVPATILASEGVAIREW